MQKRQLKDYKVERCYAPTAGTAVAISQWLRSELGRVFKLPTRRNGTGMEILETVVGVLWVEDEVWCGGGLHGDETLEGSGRNLWVSLQIG
ncbi:hypothetical protein V6N13_080117 [Hibiscus sabdariffa]|uniref:Uncharacterized protein n=1 Tax=Hibiscus sabdariffa TaxID=183260 RepID=A0ABR2PXF7_9ROSI